MLKSNQENESCFDTHPRNKEPIVVVASVAVSCREYYMREGGGFPQIRAVVSFVCQSARGLSQHSRVFPNVKLTSCDWFLDADSHNIS
jgi:hypothetical protein